MEDREIGERVVAVETFIEFLKFRIEKLEESLKYANRLTLGTLVTTLITLLTLLLR